MISKKSRRTSLFLLGILFCLFAQAGAVFAEDHAAGAAKIRALNDQIATVSEKKDMPGAVQAAEEAVRVAKAEFGKDSLQAADTLNNLAGLYLFLKRAEEAERIYKQVLRIDLEKLDKNSTEVAESYFNLGVAYGMQKKYRAALDIFNKSLLICVAQFGPDDIATQNVEQAIAKFTKLAYPKAEKI